MKDRRKCIKVIEFTLTLWDGGIESLLRDYARMIDRDKIELVILAVYIDPASINIQRIRESGVRIIPLRRFSHYDYPTRIWNKLTRRIVYPWRLWRVARAEQADVLHTHMALLFPYVRSAAKVLKGVRLFSTCHSEPRVYFEDNNTPFYYACRDLVQQNGMRMIALHEGMARELNQRFCTTGTAVIRNAIDMGPFQNVPEDRDSIRESIGVPTDAFLLGHVGRFTAEKNHTFLLEAFASVRTVRPRAHLLLVGDGMLEKQVRARIREMGLEEHVTMLSHRTDIPRLLKAMDVFILPSLYEGVPLVLVEAQAAGLRCVVSDRVTEAVYLTDKVVSLSLEAPLETWRDTILDDTVRGTPHGRLEDYDMHREIKRLEALYMGEPDAASPAIGE